jgi:hypothetical protein
MPLAVAEYFSKTTTRPSSRLSAARGGEGDDAIDFLLGQEAHEIDALAGDLAVVGEGEHGDAGLLCDRSGTLDRIGEQRT